VKRLTLRSARRWLQFASAHRAMLVGKLHHMMHPVNQ